MREFTLIELIDNLIGDVLPRGETIGDYERYENLEELCEVTEHLLLKIRMVADGENRAEDSISKAGKYASDYLCGWYVSCPHCRKDGE